MRHVRSKPSNRQISNVRVPITLRTVEQYLFPFEGRARRASRVGVIGAKRISAHISSVDAVKPPLRQSLIGAFEPAGERVRGAEVGGPVEFNA